MKKYTDMTSGEVDHYDAVTLPSIGPKAFAKASSRLVKGFSDDGRVWWSNGFVAVWDQDIPATVADAFGRHYIREATLPFLPQADGEKVSLAAIRKGKGMPEVYAANFSGELVAGFDGRYVKWCQKAVGVVQEYRLYFRPDDKDKATPILCMTGLRAGLNGQRERVTAIVFPLKFDRVDSFGWIQRALPNRVSYMHGKAA